MIGAPGFLRHIPPKLLKVRLGSYIAAKARLLGRIGGWARALSLIQIGIRETWYWNLRTQDIIGIRMLITKPIMASKMQYPRVSIFPRTLRISSLRNHLTCHALPSIVWTSQSHGCFQHTRRMVRTTGKMRPLPGPSLYTKNHRSLYANTYRARSNSRWRL